MLYDACWPYVRVYHKSSADTDITTRCKDPSKTHCRSSSAARLNLCTERGGSKERTFIFDACTAAPLSTALNSRTRPAVANLPVFPVAGIAPADIRLSPLLLFSSMPAQVTPEPGAPAASIAIDNLAFLWRLPCVAVSLMVPSSCALVDAVDPIAKENGPVEAPMLSLVESV